MSSLFLMKSSIQMPRKPVPFGGIYIVVNILIEVTKVSCSRIFNTGTLGNFLAENNKAEG